MLVFTGLTIRTVPFPTILLFFCRLEEMFTDDLWSCTFHHLPFFLSQHFIEIVFREIVHLFSTDGIHNQLGSLINIQINGLRSVESKIVRVDTFFTLLTKALFKIGTNNISWVFILIWWITTAKVFGISIEGI